MKRGYSKEFTPRGEHPARYLLDAIPRTLWNEARAKARREGKSMRALLLAFLKAYVEGN